MREALAREAARILSELVGELHVKSEGLRRVSIEADIPLQIFDRLCVWGAASIDFEEDDPAEDNGDAEPEHSF